MLLEGFTSFDDVLSDAISAVMIDTFGVAGSRVLFGHLRGWYGVDCSVKPVDLVLFEGAVVDFLGSGGEMVLRKLVVYISEGLGVEFNDWGRGFRENILYLRNLFENV